MYDWTESLFVTFVICFSVNISFTRGTNGMVTIPASQLFVAPEEAKIFCILIQKRSVNGNMETFSERSLLSQKSASILHEIYR